MQKALEILRKTFGYGSFWPHQEEIIRAVLKGSDVMAVLPTGGGKSVCYQIPALILPGITVVISPLISLMKDQVDQVNKLGVTAVVLNSSLSPQEYDKNKTLIINKTAKLLYIAPESLFKPDIQAMLAFVQPSLIAVDEAHCVSVWGHDFRPEYRRLVRLRDVFKAAVWIALTATATEKVRKDIETCLGLKNPGVFIGSFNRKNLFLEVRAKADSYGQIKGILEDFKDESGIIYCFSRKSVDILTEKLQRDGYRVRPYHAGLSDDERRVSQQLFVNDSVSVIVATIAFGMGINKPDVRFVIHHDLPKNLESYYQEIGRAGRDGLPSHCVLLYNYGDMRKQMVFIDEIQDPELKASAVRHLNDMVKYAEYTDCRRVPLLRYFGEEYHDSGCGGCDNCAGQKPDGKETDLTVPARLFLSVMTEIDESFGSEHVINILRGSSGEKIIKFRHDELASYGAGKNKSKKEWQQIRDQMVREKLIKKDLDRFGILKILPRGRDVLGGRELFKGYISEETPGWKESAGHSKKSMQYDRDLFEILRGHRKEIAGRENVPPYVIFPDTALIHMCRVYPTDRADFSGITGVGQYKLEKYAGEFIPVILKYLNENPGKKPVERQSENNVLPASGPALTGKNLPRHQVIGSLFNEGQAIERIAENHSIKKETVISHLLHFVRDGHSISLPCLLKYMPHSGVESKQILDEFKKYGGDYLKPVFEAFQGRYTYDELRIYQLLFLNEELRNSK